MLKAEARAGTQDPAVLMGQFWAPGFRFLLCPLIWAKPAALQPPLALLAPACCSGCGADSEKIWLRGAKGQRHCI